MISFWWGSSPFLSRVSDLKTVMTALFSLFLFSTVLRHLAFFMDVISDRERWNQQGSWGEREQSTLEGTQGCFRLIEIICGVNVESFFVPERHASVLIHFRPCDSLFHSLAVSDWWVSIDRSTNMSKWLQNNKQIFVIERNLVSISRQMLGEWISMWGEGNF